MGAGIATFEGTPFIRRQSTPDPVVLAGLHGPTQADLHDLTAMADSFCLFDLTKRLRAVPDRKEQLRILVETGSTVTPSHQDRAP